jgi:hypothetical protein
MNFIVNLLRLMKRYRHSGQVGSNRCHGTKRR